MFLIIESGGQVQVCRQLSPTESLDCAHHAEKYADAIGYPLDIEHPTHTGIGADVDVTIQPTKKPGAAHVWNSRGYCFAEGDTE
jgi:hypothetical protein